MRLRTKHKRGQKKDRSQARIMNKFGVTRKRANALLRLTINAYVHFLRSSSGE